MREVQKLHDMSLFGNIHNMCVCLQPGEQYECNFLCIISYNFCAVCCLCFVFTRPVHVFRCSTYPFVYSGAISLCCMHLLCEYRKHGTFLLRHALSLHVCIFIREHVLAYVSRLSCVVRIFLLLAYARCMHLEASIYAFCFNTLLALLRYSVGERGLCCLC